MVSQRWLDLILEHAAVDGVAIFRRSRRRRASLYDKARYAPVERRGIVGPARRQGQERIAGFGGSLAEQFKLQVAMRCVQRYRHNA